MGLHSSFRIRSVSIRSINYSGISTRLGRSPESVAEFYEWAADAVIELCARSDGGRLPEVSIGRESRAGRGSIRPRKDTAILLYLDRTRQTNRIRRTIAIDRTWH